VTLLLALLFMVTSSILGWFAIKSGSDLHALASLIEKIALGVGGLMGFFAWGNRAEHTK